MNLLLAVLLVIQTLGPDGRVIAVNIVYDLTPERCAELAKGHELARCLEREPSREELFVRMERT